ncbi:MAG: GNAT family N-acetyltransferase [Bryobacterales bacterium]|nr:GNAT family N-acetyltransferase [Bryobacterales bacterium]
MQQTRVERLTLSDLQRARELFLLIADVFETERRPLGDAYLVRLLARPEFWALTISVDGRMVGGLTAHTLPLTRIEEWEIFLYDIAVLPEYQRRGLGRQLVEALREQAAAEGITTIWVPADNEDTHALDFYQALGGEPAPVTIFTFSPGAAAT